MICRLIGLLILCSNVQYALCQDFYKCIENNITIDYYSTCDGNRDCLHGSDESAAVCKYERPSDDDVFHCANGAVVPIGLRCNGYMECADNSDEAKRLCWEYFDDFKRDKILESRRGKCPENQWQCPTESEFRCIYPNQTCDNVFDCSNGWDESVDICMTECSEDQFQCGNGVCIKKTQLCDNTLDCIDGTDELPVACKDISGWLTRQQVFCNQPTELHLEFSNETQFYSFIINHTNFVYPNMGVRFVCHNKNFSVVGNEWNVCTRTGQWLHKLPQCETNMDPKTNGTMGCPLDTYAKYNGTLKIYKCKGHSKSCYKRTEPPINNNIVRFECEQGYTLLPNVERAQCINKTWKEKNFRSPRCVRFCKREELYCLDSVKPACIDENGVAIDCMKKELFPPKSTAILGCNFGFKNVDAVKVTCLEDGTWENIANIRNACQFDCMSPGVALSKNAIHLKLNQTPSVVFIYEADDQTSYFNYSCVGTIIRPNVILTAGHCVCKKTKEALRVIRKVGIPYITITDGWAVEEMKCKNYDERTLSMDVGILRLELKHSGDDMSDAICLPGYKNKFSLNFKISRGEFDALQTLDDDTNTVGNLTMVVGDVINQTYSDYHVALRSHRQLCVGDSGSGFISTCGQNQKEKCLYGVLSHSIRSTDGVEKPCGETVVVSRLSHRGVNQFIIKFLDEIESKCAT